MIHNEDTSPYIIIGHLLSHRWVFDYTLESYVT